MHENCLTYAWRLWRYARGDHLVIRKSFWGWFPHFKVLFELVDGTLVVKEFAPVEPRRRWIPPLFFKGQEITKVYSKERQCECSEVPPRCGGCPIRKRKESQ